MSYTHKPATRCSSLTSRTPVRALRDSDTTTSESSDRIRDTALAQGANDDGARRIRRRTGEQPEIFEPPHALLLMFEALLRAGSRRKSENSAKKKEELSLKCA